MSMTKKIVAAVLTASVSVGALSAAYAQTATGGQQFKMARAEGGQMRGSEERGAMFFARFDADGDGVINKTELSEATAENFASTDTDGDGNVSLAEFKVSYMENTMPKQVRTFQRMDLDGDGTVTKAEYEDVAGRMFARLDRMGGRGGQGEQAGKWGRSDDRSEGYGRGGYNDDDDNDRRGKWGKGEGKHVRDGERGGRDGGRRFGRGGRGGPLGALIAQFDVDNNGKVSREEFDTKSAELFASADTNGSGGFELDDFANIWATLNDRDAVRKFQALDTNGDLSVTQQEQSKQAEMMLDRMDRNDDGVISKADFGPGMRGHGKRGHGGEHKRG
ncbi:MAG: EF-hand domain-containing protein [Rhodobacteraceae bacterium]|nr:EF-hand domain-containing protein [Paracoccaceae bacterium]